MGNDGEEVLTSLGNGLSCLEWTVRSLYGVGLGALQRVDP